MHFTARLFVGIFLLLSFSVGLNLAVKEAEAATTLNQTPGLYDPSSDPIFQFSSPSTANFDCRLDGSSWQDCFGIFTPSNLSDGQHQFEVKAKDGSDLSPVSYSWTVDTVLPDTVFIKGPETWSNDSQPSWLFASNEEDSTFECRINEENWSNCTPPWKPTLNVDGVYTFEIRAIDRAGNVDDNTVLKSMVLDTQAPQTIIKIKPDSVWDKPKQNFQFSSNETDVEYQCSLDQDWIPCNTEYSFESFKNGNYTLRVRARDLAGNVDLEPAVYQWKLNLPSPAFLSAPSMSGLKTRSATIKCNRGIWDNDPVLKLSWVVNGSLSNNTSYTYKLNPQEQGARINCKISASNQLDQTTVIKTSPLLFFKGRKATYLKFPSHLDTYEKKKALYRQKVRKCKTTKCKTRAKKELQDLPQIKWYTNGEFKILLRLWCRNVDVKCKKVNASPNSLKKLYPDLSQLEELQPVERMLFKRAVIKTDVGNNELDLNRWFNAKSLSKGSYKVTLRILGPQGQHSNFLYQYFEIS